MPESHDEDVRILNTDQPGHWYKCQNTPCKYEVPLPDKIFIDPNTDEHISKLEYCKRCGHMNIFKISEAGNKTTKSEVDKYIKRTNSGKEFDRESYWKE